MNTGGVYGGAPRQTEAADFAQAMAGGVGSIDQLLKNSAFPTNVAAVAPANLTAPSSAVVALFAVTPVRTGRFAFDFALTYTDSAADTVTASASIFTGVTSVSGGTNVGAAPAPVFTWESSAITVTGGSAVAVPSVATNTIAGAASPTTLRLSGLLFELSKFWLVMEISATHNLSAMLLTASIGEF